MSANTSNRTVKTAKDEYEIAWELDEKLIDDFLVEHPDASIHEIAEMVSQHKANSFAIGDGLRQIYQAFNLLSDDGTPTARLVVDNGCYQTTPKPMDFCRLVSSSLGRILTDSPHKYDTVVELGSGWGRNLIGIHSELPPELGNEIEFHAFELTVNGRNLTKKLADHSPGMKLQIHPFNFYSPDFSPLKNRKALVFTSLAIEQIPSLPEDVFQELLANASCCEGWHLEPVGWQLDPELQRARVRTSSAGTIRGNERQHISISRSELGTSTSVGRNAMLWSRDQDYNQNLIALLKEQQAKKQIVLTDIQRDYYGVNPFNPMSIVQWKKI